MADGDFAGFYRTDSEMHELILCFTGFRRLATLAGTAWVHVNRARQLILPEPGRVQNTLAEHQAILAALEARDPAAAREATQGTSRPALTILEPLMVERRFGRGRAERPAAAEALSIPGLIFRSQISSGVRGWKTPAAAESRPRSPCPTAPLCRPPQRLQDRPAGQDPPPPT